MAVNFWLFFRNLSIFFGVLSVLLGISVASSNINPESARPLILICFCTAFLLFPIFILVKIFSEDDKNDTKFSIRIFLQRLNEFGAEISKYRVFYVISVVIFLLGVLLWHQTGYSGPHWSPSQPFERVHAIVFASLSSVFLSFTIPTFSIKADNDTEKAHVPKQKH
jgi:hypothetical protein